MSRHRNLIRAEDYDDDDYDDYDDYDDDYHEERYSEAARRTSQYYDTPGTAMSPGEGFPAEPPLDFVQFVLSALGDAKRSPSQSEVLTKLEESHYDVERTIDFFLSQCPQVVGTSKGSAGPGAGKAAKSSKPAASTWKSAKSPLHQSSAPPKAQGG